MNFLKNFKKKRNIKQLAYYNKEIEYCQELIDATQKCINDLEKGLERVLSGPSEVFVVSYSSYYTKPLENHRKYLSRTRANLKYWETLRDGLLKQMGEK